MRWLDEAKDEAKDGDDDDSRSGAKSDDDAKSLSDDAKSLSDDDDDASAWSDDGDFDGITEIAAGGEGDVYNAQWNWLRASQRASEVSSNDASSRRDVLPHNL